MQEPVALHRQHAFCWMVPPVQHPVGQEVVTPLQVTCPLSRTEQLRSTELQLVELTSLEQVTVPDAQFAVAVQRAFSSPISGCLAAKRTPLGCAAQEPAAG
jgi:hypothetical protein